MWTSTNRDCGINDENGKEIIMNNIHLEKLTWDTVDDVLKLKVSKEQKGFVAPNRDSMIDAYFALTEKKFPVYTFGIYLGEKPVGFLMIGFNEAACYEDGFDVKPPEILKNNYSIWRLMIDKRYQGRGYGREAIRLALDFIRTWPCGKAEFCSLSYEPENEVAGALYRSCGFAENGELDGDEIVAVLKL